MLAYHSPRRWAPRLVLFCALLPMAGLGASPAHASPANVDVAAFVGRPGMKTITATGKVGDVVKVTVGIYSQQPGKAEEMGSSPHAQTWTFTLPPGTESVRGPVGDLHVSPLGRNDSDRCDNTSGGNTSNGERKLFGTGPYACVSSTSLEPGERSELTFYLRINKVIPNATGEVVFDRHLTLAGDASLTDSNPDNDEASVIINPDRDVAVVIAGVPVTRLVLVAAFLLLLTIGVGLFLYVRSSRAHRAAPAVPAATKWESGTAYDAGRD